MALKATRITGPYSPPEKKRRDHSSCVDLRVFCALYSMRRNQRSSYSARIRGRDYRGLAEALQLFCAEIQLFGATVANFLRASSSSFGSVQTS